MTEEQMEVLPSEYLKKFGSFIIRKEQSDGDARIEANRSIRDYYEQIKNLDKLKTNEEIEAIEALKNQQRADAVEMPDYDYSRDNYMMR
jgi:hypothetical protein